MIARKVGSIFFILLLTACESLPHLSMKGPDFKPLTSEVALMAAPEAPPVEMPPLYCAISKGAVRVAKGWVDFKEVDFTLPSGGKTQVRLQTAGSGDLAVQGFFDAEGQKLIFCPVLDVPPDERISCSSIYALEDDLQMGIKRTFDVPDAVRGGNISCAYERGKLKSL